VFISLTGQIRKNLELLAKLTKELVPAATTAVTNNTSIQLFRGPRMVRGDCGAGSCATAISGGAGGGDAD